MNQEFLNQAALKCRGWTLGAIANHLGEPDLCSSRQNLWKASRVEAVESKLDFQIWKLKREEKKMKSREKRSRLFREHYQQKYLESVRSRPPMTEEQYQILEQLRAKHPYLIGIPIHIADGFALIEAPGRWQQIAEKLIEAEASEDFEAHGLILQFDRDCYMANR